jgi:CheY-like chemotaxis protein
VPIPQGSASSLFHRVGNCAAIRKRIALCGLVGQLPRVARWWSTSSFWSEWRDAAVVRSRLFARGRAMDADVRGFGHTATSLARNPLGIIALFIVLVYGFAALVTAFSGSFSSTERAPLVYFLVAFPVLVLIVFAWLVSNHAGKLFAPADFKDEQHYVDMVRMQLSAAASLAVATTKTQEPRSQQEILEIVDVVQKAAYSRHAEVDGWRNHILWVDDRPNNNIHERQAFEAFGLRFTLSLSTDEALREVSRQQFAAIISDMGRREGPREGYVLLDKLRQQGNQTPLFFYASSNAPAHKRETIEHGGQGCTNNAQELFQMVARSVITNK